MPFQLKSTYVLKNHLSKKYANHWTNHERTLRVSWLLAMTIKDMEELEVMEFQAPSFDILWIYRRVANRPSCYCKNQLSPKVTVNNL